MSLTIRDIFDVIAPEFSIPAETDAALDAAIGKVLQLAALRVDIKFPNADQAIAFLAAHLMSLRARSEAAVGSGGGAPAGAITFERAGQVSVQYASGTSAANSAASARFGAGGFESTMYGREYLNVLSQMPISAGIATALREADYAKEQS